jgi:hypothetical protein
MHELLLLHGIHLLCSSFDRNENCGQESDACCRRILWVMPNWDWVSWQSNQWVPVSWSVRKSWIRGVLLVWLMLGLVCAALIIQSRKTGVEREKNTSMDAWCKQRSTVLEEQVKANKNSAKVVDHHGFIILWLHHPASSLSAFLLLRK